MITKDICLLNPAASRITFLIKSSHIPSLASLAPLNILVVKPHKSLAILTYAIDNKESFNHVENWLNDLKSQANPDVRIFLVGNKADLEEDRKIKKEEGEKYKEDQHLDLFMETSAKTGHNARNVLVEAAKILYKDYLKFDENTQKEKEDESKNKDKKKLIKKEQKAKKGCC